MKKADDFFKNPGNEKNCASQSSGVEGCNDVSEPPFLVGFHIDRWSAGERVVSALARRFAIFMHGLTVLGSAPDLFPSGLTVFSLVRVII